MNTINQKLWIGIVAMAMAMVMVTAIPAGAAPKAGQVITGTLTRIGTTQVGQLPGSAGQVLGNQIFETPEVDLLEGKAALVSRSALVSLETPRPENLGLASGERIARGFPGTSHLAQR
ncbi:MAG: hypothetical protein ABI651_15655, partial [Verrucomicrobiota bacterium]